MAHAGSDEILAAALEQLARERGSAPDESLIAHSMYDPSGTYIPHTDTEEPHNTNPVLFTDEYGRDIRGSMSTEDANRPGLHDPADVEAGRVLNDDNVIPYPIEEAVEDEISNAIYNQLFEIAGRNPVGDSVPIKPFETNKGIEYMPYPYGPVQNFPRA